MDRRIIIFSNVYNCDKTIEKHIKSIIKQNYTNWLYILTNDASNDKTDQIIKRILPKNNDKIIYRTSQNKKGIVWNAFHDITQYVENDSDILYIMNGSDWLPHENVFRQINTLYDKGCLVTCGGSLISTKKRFFYNYNYDDILDKKYRTDGVFYSPITFNAILWFNLKQDLFIDGIHSTIGCYEYTIPYAIIDMIPKNYIAFIKNDPIYTFNIEYNYREKYKIEDKEYYKSLKFDEVSVESYKLNGYVEEYNEKSDEISTEFVEEKIVDDLHFIIFASGFNCEKWIDKHIKSILDQTYTNFTYIIVDDKTTDSTYNRILQYKDPRIKLYRPTSNQKWCKNSWDYLRPNIKNEEDVVVVVDLDDWLSHNKVLEKLNKVYKEEKCWITYGSHTRVGQEKARCSPVNKIILNNRLYRKAPWEFSHLKTFKAFLYMNIKEKDFKDMEGKWLPHTYDKALMFPILEMTPSEKIKHISEILYIYNSQNPLNVSKVNKKENKSTYGKWLREQPSYELLVRE